MQLRQAATHTFRLLALGAVPSLTAGLILRLSPALAHAALHRPPLLPAARDSRRRRLFIPPPLLPAANRALSSLPHSAFRS
jgi:hypothetical protein